MDLPGAEQADPVDGEVMSLSDAIATAKEEPRIQVGIDSWDFILGGGLVKGSLTLLCGDPGSGKSTILIQALRSIAIRRHTVLYITGEQQVKAVALRAKNFGSFPGRFSIVREKYIDAICDFIEEHEPEVVVIDSIQTIVVDEDYGHGTSASIKAAISVFMDVANKKNVTFIIIGHVTKDGGIGGPRALEHYVDTNLYLQGSKRDKFRSLRCDFKNRGGETPRAAKFEMTKIGLVEVSKFESHPENGLVPVREPDDCDAESDETATVTTAARKKPANVPPKPVLKSIPLDDEVDDKSDGESDNDDDDDLPADERPSDAWVAPDGTPAAQVLTVPCDVPECLGKIDRACSTENGTREAGFHQSRVTKARLKIVTAAPVVGEVPEELPPDPFAKKFGAPPRKASTRPNARPNAKPKPKRPKPPTKPTTKPTSPSAA